MGKFELTFRADTPQEAREEVESLEEVQKGQEEGIEQEEAWKTCGKPKKSKKDKKKKDKKSEDEPLWKRSWKKMAKLAVAKPEFRPRLEEEVR